MQYNTEVGIVVLVKHNNQRAKAYQLGHQGGRFAMYFVVSTPCTVTPSCAIRADARVMVVGPILRTKLLAMWAGDRGRTRSSDMAILLP